MNQPYVKSLKYKLETTEGTSFDARPITCETDYFSLCLEEDELVIELKKDFVSVQSARKYIEDFLRTWEVESGLQYGKQEITFKYEGASIIERTSSSLDQSHVVQLSGISSTIIGMSAKANVIRSKYPDPPHLFNLSPDAETLWKRYEGYKQDREPLFSMAYFCLTLIQTRAESRDKATKVFNISYKVLDTLGELCTNRGNNGNARKFTSNLKPATGAEKIWTDRTIRALIKQIGIYDRNNMPKKLTMKELPELK